MHWESKRPSMLAVVLLGALNVCGYVAAQTGIPSEQPGGQDAAGIIVTCEVFCSETKLRTGNARISWRLTAGPGGPEAFGIGDMSSAEQRLETTVFKNGFDKDLYASFQTLERGTETRPALESSLEPGAMRAYQLQIIEVKQPAGMEALGAGGATLTDTVIEGLEPGMNYTWRVVVETDDGQLVSKTVMCQAPVCPADIREEDEP